MFGVFFETIRSSVSVALALCTRAYSDKTEVDALKATLAKHKLDSQQRESKLKSDLERAQRTIEVRPCDACIGVRSVKCFMRGLACAVVLSTAMC